MGRPLTPPAGRTRGGWLPRSFALRLGIGFALVVLAGATLTAVVVNTAFAARFDRYLAQQQAAQLASIGAAISRAYSGNGTWDRQALATVVPTVGAGTVRVLTPGGQRVWQWDGHAMRWDDHWTQDGGEHSTQQPTEPTRPGGDGSAGSEHRDQQGTSGRSTAPSNDGWDAQGAWVRGGVATVSLPLAGQTPGARLVVAAASSTTSPSGGSAGPGPTQRIPIMVGGTVVGTALVRLPQATALPAAVAFRAQVIRLLLWGGMLGALLSLGLGIFFARRATRPVRQITAAARALAAGDRSVRLDADRADEFGEMGRAFNAMADAVEGQERLRRGFAAEVAHELRTPLTILRSQVEGLRVGVLAPTGQALGSLDEEVGRMTRLVADLQVLSAADAASFSLEHAPTDLRALVDQTVGEVDGLFEGSEVRLVTSLEPVTAQVDRVRVGQVLANLLSNALKFTLPGGLVRVELQADADWAVLRVTDSGPGIPVDELPHVFDRFWRGRTSRAGGSGIGLTVVRELVTAHGGTVEASSQPGHGATFTVHLPVQSTASDNRFHTASSQPRPTVGT